MKNKILVIAVILCIFTAVQVHSFGLGAQINFSVDTEGESAMGFSLLISPSEMTHIALNWYIDGETNIIGFTMDACPLKLRIAGDYSSWTLNFTLGIGFYANLVFSEKFDITPGLRLPIGLSFFLGNNLEFFTHIAPSYGVSLLPTLTFTDAFFPMALGARLWFN
jgi:hypothetical protein